MRIVGGSYNQRCLSKGFSQLIFNLKVLYVISYASMKYLYFEKNKSKKLELYQLVVPEGERN